MDTHDLGLGREAYTRIKETALRAKANERKRTGVMGRKTLINC